MARNRTSTLCSFLASAPPTGESPLSWGPIPQRIRGGYSGWVRRKIERSLLSGEALAPLRQSVQKCRGPGHSQGPAWVNSLLCLSSPPSCSFIISFSCQDTPFPAQRRLLFHRKTVIDAGNGMREGEHCLLIFFSQQKVEKTNGVNNIVLQTPRREWGGGTRSWEETQRGGEEALPCLKERWLLSDRCRVI